MPEVMSVSRSGRQRRAPGKFRHPRMATSRPHGRPIGAGAAKPGMRLDGGVDGRYGPRAGRRVGGASSGPSIYARQYNTSGGRRIPISPRAGTTYVGASSKADDEQQVRVGEVYQALVPRKPDPTECVERGDILVWSPSMAAKAFPKSATKAAAAIDAYIAAACPLLGGPPRLGGPPPAETASDEAPAGFAPSRFPAESALELLHEARYDTKAALAALRERSEADLKRERWTKARMRPRCSRDPPPRSRRGVPPRLRDVIAGGGAPLQRGALEV